MNECLCGNELLPYPPTCSTCMFPICGMCLIQNGEKCLNCCIGVCPRCQYQYSFTDGIECSWCVKTFCSLECATLRHPYCSMCSNEQCENSTKHRCVKCNSHLCKTHYERRDATKETCVPPGFCAVDKNKCTIGDCLVNACNCSIVNKIPTLQYIPNMCHLHRMRAIYYPCYGCKLFYCGGGWITFKSIMIPGPLNTLAQKQVEVCPVCLEKVRALLRVLLHYGLDRGIMEKIVFQVLLEEK